MQRDTLITVHHAMGVVEPIKYDAYLEFVSDFDI